MRSHTSVSLFGILVCVVCDLTSAQRENDTRKPIGPFITSSTRMTPDENMTFTCTSYASYEAPQLSWLFGTIEYHGGQVDVPVGNNRFNSSINLTLTMRKEDHNKPVVCILKQNITGTVSNDTRIIHMPSGTSMAKSRGVSATNSIVSIVILFLVMGALFGGTYFCYQYSKKDDVKVTPQLKQDVCAHKSTSSKLVEAAAT